MKNETFRYGALCARIASWRRRPACDHDRGRAPRRAIGRNRTAMNGSVRLDASKMPPDHHAPGAARQVTGSSATPSSRARRRTRPCRPSARRGRTARGWPRSRRRTDAEADDADDERQALEAADAAGEPCTGVVSPCRLLSFDTFAVAAVLARRRARSRRAIELRRAWPRARRRRSRAG